VNSVVHLQNGEDTFVSQNAAGKKELLLEIVQAEKFDSLYEQTKKQLTRIEKFLSADMAKREFIVSSLTTARSRVGTIENERASLKKLEEVYQSIQERIQNNNVALSEYASIEKTLDQHKKTLELLQSRSFSLKKELSENEGKLSQISEIKTFLSTCPDVKGNKQRCADSIKNIELSIAGELQKKRDKEAFFSQKPQTTDFEVSINALESQLDVFNKSEHCQLGELCPHEKNALKNKEFLVKQIESLKEKRDRELTILKKWEEEYAVMPEPLDRNSLDIFEGTLTGLRKELENHTLAESNIQNKQWLLGQLESSMRDASTIELELTVADNNIYEASQRIEDLEKDDSLSKVPALRQENFALASEARNVESNLIETKGTIKVLEDTIIQIEAWEEELVSLDKSVDTGYEDTRKLQLLKEAFGSTGIKTVVIDYILPDLEDRINNILHQMSDFSVRLDTQQEKADGEGSKEGLFITVINDMGEEMAFENFSGGERLKIIVAFSEALSTLQKVGFLIFDELFLGLDENSTVSFLEVLEKLNKDFDQVLCISHLEQIKASFEKKLLVKKHNGITQVI
jgi:exonuclease SbcC